MLQRDIIIINSLQSSTENAANLKTTVAGGVGGAHATGKSQMFIGHVGELHYVSLMPAEISPSQSVERDYKTCDTPTQSIGAQHESCSPSMLTDIGYAVDHRNQLTDAERLSFLENPWIPSTGFTWPYTERVDGGKIRKKYLGMQHVTGVNEVFAYSTAKHGLFCRMCVLFAPDFVGGIPLDRLVKSPLQKYTHLGGRDGYLTSHLKAAFHENSVMKANAFRSQMLNSRGDISKQLRSEYEKQRERNRAALKRIIRAVEFHGRLGLPLRGHDDCGELPTIEHGAEELNLESHIDYGKGNLRALLQLMMDCNDTVLRGHFLNTPRNATYISPLSQNAIIESAGQVLLRQIVLEVQDARFFTLLADETTDFSRREQLSVCLRYLSEKLGKWAVVERLLCFADAPDLTGDGLARQLLKILADAGIDKQFMVGQGYDGAGAMSGKDNGVQKHIRDACPAAVYVHCAAHCLNLCLSKASDVLPIRSAVTLMNELAVFFCESNKRLQNLQQFILSECPQSAHTRLTKQCTTRWVEKQTAVFVFKELFPAVVASLQDMTTWSGDTGGKAAMFLRSIDNIFLLAMELVHAVLAVTKPLSVKLQGTPQDNFRATESVRDCIEVLQSLRDGDMFDIIFDGVEKNSGRSIEMPHLTSRQMHRINAPAGCPLQHYRRNLFYPFIDTCIAQLHERFSSHTMKASLLSGLIPAFCCDRTFKSIKDGVDHYRQVVNF